MAYRFLGLSPALMVTAALRYYLISRRRGPSEASSTDWPVVWTHCGPSSSTQLGRSFSTLLTMLTPNYHDIAMQLLAQAMLVFLVVGQWRALELVRDSQKYRIGSATWSHCSKLHRRKRGRRRTLRRMTQSTRITASAFPEEWPSRAESSAFQLSSAIEFEAFDVKLLTVDAPVVRVNRNSGNSRYDRGRTSAQVGEGDYVLARCSARRSPEAVYYNIHRWVSSAKPPRAGFSGVSKSSTMRVTLA